MKHLSIELSETAVRFSVVENGMTKSCNYTFTDKKDYRYKEQLDEFLVDSGLKNQEFDEQTISWSSKRVALSTASKSKDWIAMTGSIESPGNLETSDLRADEDDSLTFVEVGLIPMSTSRRASWVQ